MSATCNHLCSDGESATGSVLQAVRLHLRDLSTRDLEQLHRTFVPVNSAILSNAHAVNVLPTLLEDALRESRVQLSLRAESEVHLKLSQLRSKLKFSRRREAALRSMLLYHRRPCLSVLLH